MLTLLFLFTTGYLAIGVALYLYAKLKLKIKDIEFAGVGGMGKIFSASVFIIGWPLIWISVLVLFGQNMPD